LHTIANKATGILCNTFCLLARVPSLTQSNRLTLYIRSILTYATPVCISTCPSNYLKLPATQSECLRVISNYPRRTATFHSHDTVNIDPFLVIIHQLTAKFFAYCPSHPNPLVQQIGNYTPASLTNMYEKYKKTTEAHSAVISSPTVAVFFRIFHCCYLYSVLFHFFHRINIYSNWSGEQFCNLSSNMLYVCINKSPT